MKKLTKIMEQHPWVACLFASAFASISTGYAFREDWLIGCAIIFLVLLLCMVFGIIRSVKKLIVLLLACLLLTPIKAQEPKQDSGGCAAIAAGVVVVVFGGVVCVKIWKFCQKHFPKAAAQIPPPPATNNVPGVTNTIPKLFESRMDTAAFPYGYLGSCPQHCNDQQSLLGGTHPATFNLRIRVDENNSKEPVLSHSIVVDSSSYRTWTEFQDDVSKLGLTITEYPSPPTFAQNGNKVEPDQSPISISGSDHCVRVARNGTSLYKIKVIRSSDLVNWVDLLSIELESGMSVVVIDTEARGQQFYKYSATLSD